MLQTEYIPAKTIVTRTRNTYWFGAHYNMNIYRGCSHGCLYCDSRSECYGIDRFDTVRVKENALEIIRNDLRRKIRPDVISTGAMSDPYNPLEAELMLTRNALQLIHAYGFGVGIATKSPLITRDADLIKDIGGAMPVIVKMTVTTANDDLAQKIEPNVAPSSERFAALETLARQGIFSGILLMPVLPFIEDNEENILSILRRTHECGARFVYAAPGVTMRQGQREYMLARLESLFPGMRAKYQKAFGSNYNCPSPQARSLWKVFTAECQNLGLLYKMPEIISAYKQGYGDSQLTFFQDPV